MAGVPLRVAAIDCGTNALRLLVAETVPGSGTVQPLHRETRIVRLGEGVDAERTLTTAAIDRAWSVLAGYHAVVAAAGVVDLRIVATSALRDVGNAGVFDEMVRSVTGRGVEVLTGEQEALLGFRGTCSGPVGDGDLLTLDIGGGSTELVAGRTRAGRSEVLAHTSIDVGAVRITERVLRGDPPTAEQLDRARTWCRQSLLTALDAWPAAVFPRLQQVVAVAGTALTVGAGALRLPRLDEHALDGAAVELTAVRRTADLLLGATRAHRAVLGWVAPGRVDVIGGGALVLATVLDELERRSGIRSVVLSVRDILDGVALSVADRLLPDGPAAPEGSRLSEPR